MNPYLRLSQIDAALHDLDKRRGALLAERAGVLAHLAAAAPPRQTAPQGAPPVQPAAVPQGQPAGAGQWQAPRPAYPGQPRVARAETSPVTAQAVLLVLGGLLLSVAAVVFTVVAWGRVGIGGKSVILLAMTGTVLGVPVALTRRRLTGSAEAVAAVGLVLTVLDAYATYAVDLAGLGGVDGGWYVAGAAAVLAGLWWGYGALTGLVGPRVAAVVAAQVPLPLLVATAGGKATAGAAAYAVLAGLDVALVAAVRRGLAAAGRGAAAVAWVAGVAGALGWLVAVTAAAGPASGARTGVVLPAALVLLLAAAVAGGAAAVAPAGHPRDWAAAVATAGGAAAGFAALRLAVHPVLAAAVVAAPLAVAAGLLPARTWRRGVWWAAGGLLAAAAAVPAAGALRIVAGALSWTAAVWSGAPHGAVAALTAPGTAGGTLPPTAALSAALLAGAACLTLAAQHGALRAAMPIDTPDAASVAARRGALAAVAAAVVTVVVPLVVLLDPPYAVALAGLAAVAALAAVLACRPAGWPARLASPAAAVPALVLGGAALAWSLAGRTPTTALLAVTVAVAAWCGTGAGRPGRVAAAVAGLAAQALTVALTTVEHGAYPLLGVGAALALLGALLPAGRGTALRLSVVPGALAAVLLATGRPDVAAAAALLLVLLAATLPTTLGNPVLLGAAVPAWLAAARIVVPYATTAGAPLRWLADPWSGTARFEPLHGTAAGSVLGTVALLGAGVVWLARRYGPTATAVAATCAAAALAVPVPAVAGWPYLAGLLWLAALTVVAAALTTRYAAAGPLAAALAALTAAAALATEPATVATLAGTAVVATAVAVTARDAVARAGARWAAVLATAGDAAAVAGWSGAEAGSMVAAGLAVAGICLGALALADHRLGYPSGAALLAATWVQLGTAGVTVPEAYTAPAAAAALVLGLMRRRTAGVESSWVAYGPGLALALLPSLAATLQLAERPVRTALLAAVALAVTLAGARGRLQAPLVAGAGTLAVLALYELGPAVLLWVGGLPRWIPIAVVGTVLLTVGATYERRLRDLQRLRATVARLG
jgi:hypothetical protein